MVQIEGRGRRWILLLKFSYFINIIDRGTILKKMTTETSSIKENTASCSWSSLFLDSRITKILERDGFSSPTIIQERAIPLALSGKDIVAKAPTGSGKTLSYVLPILQSLVDLVEGEDYDSSIRSIHSLILVPTKELAKQVHSIIKELTHYLPKSIITVNLASEDKLPVQRALLGGGGGARGSSSAGTPSIVISTPTRILPHLDAGTIDFGRSATNAGTTETTAETTQARPLQHFVVDEADLIFSFGYKTDLDLLISKHLPRTVQTFLLSATLMPEMDELKKLIMRSPQTIKVDSVSDVVNDDDLNYSTTTTTTTSKTSKTSTLLPATLQQYVMKVEKDEDKFLLMYVILKLKLLKGKILIFAGETERCFKLRLFLEQFGIRVCLLNGELPSLTRHHIVDEFNRSIYDIIIASDESVLLNKKNESGVSRGVDFKLVDVVINFDLPRTAATYVHRVGRTARGKAVGTAISFVNATSLEEEKMLSSINGYLFPLGDMEVETHSFDIHQLDGFRYRCGDAFRAVTRSVIKKARLKEIKSELLKEEKLKQYWASRPQDLQALRHDQDISVIAKQAQLRNVPSYLLNPCSVASVGGANRGDGIDAPSGPFVHTISSLPQTTLNSQRRDKKNNSNSNSGVGKRRKFSQKKDPLRKKLKK